MSFDETLRCLRIETGLSFQKLSERSHVDVAYLHRLETGRATRPGRNVIIRITFGLNLNLEDTEELLLKTGHLTLVPVTKCATQRGSKARMKDRESSDSSYMRIS